MLTGKNQNSLSIKTSKGLKEKFKIGQIVDAEIIEKKDKQLLVKIDGVVYEALTNQKLTQKRVKLMVKKLNPQLILKIITSENIKVEFTKLNRQFIVEDKRGVILETLKAIESALQTNDRLKAVKGALKLNTISLPEEIKAALKDVEKKLIRERVFDREPLAKLQKGLENLIHDRSSEKLTLIFKNILKTIETGNNDKENIYTKVPLLINSKNEELYIKKEPSSLSLVIKLTDLGIVFIEASYKDNPSITVLFNKHSSYKRLLSKEEELKKQLGGINLSLDLMDSEPIFIEKRLNIKI